LQNPFAPGKSLIICWGVPKLEEFFLMQASKDIIEENIIDIFIK